MNAHLPKHILAFGICAAPLMGSTALAAPPSSGPCSLLTSAQISSALGVTVGDAMPIATTGCSWAAPGFITTVSLADASKWDRMKAPFPGATRTPVAALGDDAFYTVLESSPGAGFATLSVKKGTTAYMFKVYSKLRAVPEQMAIEKTLAANALRNIP